MQSFESRRLFSVDFGVEFVEGIRVAGPGLPVSLSSIYVFNYGTERSAPAEYRFVIASDSELTQDVEVVETGTFGALDPETNASLDVDYHVPASLYGKNRYFGLIIDPNDVVPELGEENNRTRLYLQIASPVVGDSIVGTDGPDEISIAVANVGGTAYLVSGAVGAGESGLLTGAIPTDGSRITVDLKGGDDRFEGGGVGPLDVFGGDGDDSIRFLYGDTSLGGPGRRIEGGAGDDFLIGGSGDDTILGGDGDDVIAGGRGNDLIYGGEGNDYVRGDGNQALIGFDATGGNDTVYGDAGRDSLHGDFGDDRLAGGSGGDLLQGGDGDDTLLGQGGRDTLRGGAGVDRMIGGAGRDLFDARGDGAIDLISGNDDEDAGFFDADDALAGVEVRLA